MPAAVYNFCMCLFLLLICLFFNSVFSFLLILLFYGDDYPDCLFVSLPVFLCFAFTVCSTSKHYATVDGSRTKKKTTTRITSRNLKQNNKRKQDDDNKLTDKTNKNRTNRINKTKPSLNKLLIVYQLAIATLTSRLSWLELLTND